VDRESDWRLVELDAVVAWGLVVLTCLTGMDGCDKVEMGTSNGRRRH
jgi:hypothetical protein